MSNLDELRQAFSLATPGVWEANGFGICSLGTPLTKRADVATVTGSGLTDEYAHHTAQFIALAHNAMPVLLEAVEVLEKIKSLYASNPDDLETMDTGIKMIDDFMEKLNGGQQS